MKILRRLGWTLTVLVAAGIGIGVYVLFNPYWIKIESVQLTLAPAATQDVI
jgi:hypothetical protein